MNHQFTQNNIKIFFLCLIIFFQLIIYFPYVGTGFITDDFIWLDNVMTEGELDFLKPFNVSTGFYRPLVSLTFGWQYFFHGMNSQAYGLFNLCLHLINIIMIYLLLNLFSSIKPYTILIAFKFSLNVKSNPMAVGWISGRTTLLFAFFSILSLYLFQKARQLSEKQYERKKKFVLYFLINVFFLAALLSKEDAVMIPFFVFLFLFIFKNRKPKDGFTSISFFQFRRISMAVKSTLVFFIPLIIYFLLRIKSHAFTPFNAPESYSFGFDPFLFLKNFWEYFIRSGLLDIFIMIWFLLLFLYKKKKLELLDMDFQAMKVGILWFICLLLPVLFLRVRSDIYVYIPQVGMHLFLFQYY